MSFLPRDGFDQEPEHRPRARPASESPESYNPVEEYPGRQSPRTPSAPSNTAIKAFVTFAVWLVIAFGSLVIWQVNANWKLGFALAGVAIMTMLVTLRIWRDSEEEADLIARQALDTPVEPSRRARRVMTKDELLWQEKRQHIIVLAPWWMGLATLLVLAGLVNNQILWIVCGLCAIPVLIRFYLWWHIHCCFSNRRLFTLSGIIKREKKMMAYSRMTDQTSDIPWHSVMLSWLRIIKAPYGTFVVESAGQDQALTRVRFVPFAEAIDRKIMESILSD